METKSQFVDNLRGYSSVMFNALREIDANNGKKYLHKDLLTPEYSADMNWNAGEFSNSIVAADVVSLDSSAPLKSRGVIRSASGQVTKMSLAYKKTEKELSDLMTLQSLGGNLSSLAGKALNDVPRVVEGIDIRNELLFLQGVSEGVIAYPLEDEQGTAVRASFGYRDENKVTPAAKWSTKTANPIEDLQEMFSKASANSDKIEMVMMDTSTFNALRSSDAGKVFGASATSMVVTDPKSLRATRKEVMLEALQDEFGAKFVIVDGSYRVQEKDGTMKSVKPWAEGAVVGLPGVTAGRLVYSTLVEERRPASHVTYNKVGLYTLVSQYAETNPPTEFTIGQALCLPVIDNASSIYYLNALK